jgi:hypothetical protein
MLTSRRIYLTLLVASISLCLLVPAALAGAPATVTVRVEGLNETLLPATQVITTTTPVVKDGKPADSCPGTSALGALELATSGNWSGPWEYGQYFINTINGETHLYEPGKRSYYWSFWVKDKYQMVGACEAQLEPGSSVLFFPECDEECPSGPTPTPLEIEAPSIGSVGEPVDAIVKQYNANAEPSPAAGAEIAWPGGSTTVNAQGAATMTFSAAGSYTLHVTGSASGPPAVRTETTICAHNGNDGNCGTTKSVSGSGSSTSTSTPAGGVLPFVAYKGPFALVAHATGLIDGHVYSRRLAPRVLAGTIVAHNAVTSVSAELRRSYRGRCAAYDGARGRFLAARCGSGSFFKVASGGTFSYLLPSALAPGRYVLDIKASDAAGNITTLARGSSRLVFYVR